MTVEIFIQTFTPPADFDRHLRHLYDVWDKEIIELDAIQRVSEELNLSIAEIAMMCIIEDVNQKIDKYYFPELSH